MMKTHIKSLIVNAARSRLRCVFVLSTGRVGTETLTHLFACSPSISSHHEPSPSLFEETKAIYQSPLEDASSRDKWVADFIWKRLTWNERPLRPATVLSSQKIYAECSNRLTFAADMLAEQLPKALFVHLHREPAEFVRSAMRRQFYAGHVRDPQRITPRSDDPAYDEWSRWTVFQKCCWNWAAINRLALDLQSRLSPKRFFSLRSEELFSGNIDRIGELFQWIGVEMPSIKDVNDVLLQRHNEQRLGHFPSPDEWPAERVEELERIAGDVASVLGYEKAELP